MEVAEQNFGEEGIEFKLTMYASAARAAAQHAERTARQRLNKMIQNNNHDDGDIHAMRFDELLRCFFVDNLLPLVIWFAEVIFGIVILLILSAASYSLLYYGVIMRGLEVKSRPIFFDYDPGMQGQSSHPLPPMGKVDLRSSKRAPWAYSCFSTADNFGVNDNDFNKIYNNADCLAGEGSCPKLSNEDAKTKCLEEVNDAHPVLVPDVKYFFEVSLTLPESDINKRLGVFMVNVDLRSSDRQLLASSKQSSMLPFESNMITIFRKLSLLFPLTAGILAETRTITVLSFDNYVDVDPKRSLSFVEVTLGVPNPASFSSTLHSIQIQSSKLRYGKEMSQVQELFRSMRWPCAFLGTTFFLILYGYAALSLWRRRASRMRWNAQPYADFFSDDGSAPDRWMGADIEILEEESNDLDNWEPLDRKKGNGVNGDSAEKKESAEQIVSDEEESVSSVDQNVKGTMDTGKSCFPHGKIASNDVVKGQSNVDIQQPSREDEEKSLADMVMKGYSKYEIFTGERDIIHLFFLFLDFF